VLAQDAFNETRCAGLSVCARDMNNAVGELWIAKKLNGAPSWFDSLTHLTFRHSAEHSLLYLGSLDCPVTLVLLLTHAFFTSM
jgi:hypothetical protein